jgi:predicted DNA-binding transcriptional regulator YafY
MLLLLQHRGRTTARELADALEVSQRTILRDVEALSEAGVPIFTRQGVGGGIELIDGFQTRLTGLTTNEARCLFLVGQPQVAHRLGLGAPTLTVRNKLLNAIAADLVIEAQRLSDWFLHDPDRWSGNRIPHGDLGTLTRSINQRRKVELTIAGQPPVVVVPIGLVLKAGSWHLICSGTNTVEVVCIDDLRGTRITKQRFTPPADFDLASFWQRHTATSPESVTKGDARRLLNDLLSANDHATFVDSLRDDPDLATT